MWASDGGLFRSSRTTGIGSARQVLPMLSYSTHLYRRVLCAKVNCVQGRGVGDAKDIANVVHGVYRVHSEQSLGVPHIDESISRAGE